MQVIRQHDITWSNADVSLMTSSWIYSRMMSEGMCNKFIRKRVFHFLNCDKFTLASVGYTKLPDGLFVAPITFSHRSTVRYDKIYLKSGTVHSTNYSSLRYMS